MPSLSFISEIALEFIFHSHLVSSRIHLFYFIVFCCFSYTSYSILGFGDLYSHCPSGPYKDMASGNRSVVIFYFPVYVIELGSPVQAALQPGFDTSFLEWSSFKPISTSEPCTWPPASSTKHCEHSRPQSTAQELWAPF